jgi:hypothetical protein
VYGAGNEISSFLYFVQTHLICFFVNLHYTQSHISLVRNCRLLFESLYFTPITEKQVAKALEEIVSECHNE